MAEFMEGPESYYNKAGEFLKGSSIFYVICKTPTIFMSTGRVYDEQKNFYNLFQESLKRDIDVRYVFSLPLVKEDILAVAKKDKAEALSILDEWSMTVDNPKIKLRFIKERPQYSFLVYDEKTIFLALYPKKDKRGIIIFDNREVPFFRESFNQAFEMASDDNKKAIKDIRELVLHGRNV
jgi:hypothetical protein